MTKIKKYAVMILICGTFLFLLSAPSLSMHLRELFLSKSFDNRYDILPVPTREPGMVAYANETDFHGIRIAFSDSFPGNDPEWKKGSVKISINGADYSDPSEVVIRPSYRDSNRYHGYLALVELADKAKGSNRMAVIQRINGSDTPPKEKLRWRLLLVSEDGTVEEEIFSYMDRGDPLYRARLANFATPIAVGFHSDVLYFWPTIFYPLIYPYLSGLLGLLSAVIGFICYFISKRDKAL